MEQKRYKVIMYAEIDGTRYEILEGGILTVGMTEEEQSISIRLREQKFIKDHIKFEYTLIE